MNGALFSIFWHLFRLREEHLYWKNFKGIIKSCRNFGPSLLNRMTSADLRRLIFLFIVHISVFVIGMSLFRIRPDSKNGTHVCPLERTRTRGAFKHGWRATKPLRVRNICYLKKTQTYCAFHVGDIHIGKLSSRGRTTYLDLRTNKISQIKEPYNNFIHKNFIIFMSLNTN